MQLEIRELHKRLGVTIVFVTHDQSEALTMSDRIAVLNAGKIEQLGTPQEIYDTPRTRFVAQFIGETNLIEASVLGIDSGKATVALADGISVLVEAVPGIAVGQKVLVSLRPERIKLGNEPKGRNALHMTIADCVYHGDHIRVQLGRGDIKFVARRERLMGEWAVGAPVVASFDPRDCTVVAP
jgi:putative spermidine/putrescine transport system ATP-binding protein